MWTPKRIILLAGSFLLFTVVYLLYSLTALGRINTLPPLPDEYRPAEDGDVAQRDRTLRPIKPSPLERKLKQAFGDLCKELGWPVLLELNSRSMVLAAGKCEVGKDGRVYLEPMSLALFGKRKSDSGEVEINTLRCKEAYIRFDRPVTSFSPSEMNGRKVVEAELFGRDDLPIRITNNHRTARKGDDLEVQITRAPLYYIEKTQIVKSSGHVKLLDGECTFQDGRIQPKSKIEAEGLEMELATAPSPARPGYLPSHKPRSDNITGVKRIVLKEAVNMNMFVANGGPFPGNGKTNGTTATPRDKRAEANAPQRDDPALLHIVTPGRFEYRLYKDHDEAYFDVPTDIEPLPSPQDVTVMRINAQTGNNDMLVCKHLELRLKRRNSDAPAAKGAAAAAGRRDAGSTRRDGGQSDQGLEIETAHATGPDVTLTSDAEKLDAHGTDFFHDAAKKLSILKGVPYIEANREDSLIQAPELRIQEIPLPASSALTSAGAKGGKAAAKSYQQIQAIGPGIIHMTNKSTGKQTTHASWKERLLSTRDGNLDLLILTGSARFEDDEHDQWLQAEALKLWLLADEKDPKVMAAPVAAKKPEPAGTTKAAAMPGSSRRPHRLEALRNVLAHSPDLTIHDAARFVVHFLDVPPERMPPPSSKGNTPLAVKEDKRDTRSPQLRPAVSGSAPQPSGTGGMNRAATVAVPKPASEPNRAVTVAARKPASEPNRAVTLAAPKVKPAEVQSAADKPRPIDLSARSIEATVMRCGERMALDHLWAEGGSLDVIDKRGGVVVRQAPAKPGEQGVYIEGNTLDMNCTSDGNILVVTGDLAQLRMDKIFILGPEVHIDQVANKAWVYGVGAMEMQNTSTLEGKPLAHPVPLTVHWSDNMLFSGTYAYFYGNIQAKQDQARLACQYLQVVFDRPISLKQGMRGEQPAKVSHLAASKGEKGDSEQDVRIEDQTVEGGRLQKYQLLMGKALQMMTIPRDEEDGSRAGGKRSDANQLTLSGPGSVRILQSGGLDMTPTIGKAAPDRAIAAKAPAPEQEMKLTYISFERQMQANSSSNVASFWGAVRVLNLPSDDPHRDIDLDGMLAVDLPEGALYLRSDQLRVGTYQKPGSGETNAKQLRTYQVMDAHGHIYVRGREFTALCDHLTFNEEKDQVIFIGENDNKAVMSKAVLKGDPPKILRAKRIIYIRSTGEIKFDTIDSIDGGV